jgi:hypothetical protein
MMNQLSELIQCVDLSDFDQLPDLRRGSIILIGSDYGGHHTSSDYEVLSFLLADIQHSSEWAIKRRRVRSELPNDGRRFAFKSLGDKALSRVLPQFLAAGDLIPGLLVSVLVHKHIASLFKLVGRIAESDPEISEFPGWKPKVMERLLRVAHFASLFIAGLSRANQDVLWITDEDAIAPNETKHQQLVTIFGRICSHYLSHNLSRIRVATTASDTGKRDVEDFVALSDLAAGALAEIVTLHARNGTLGFAGITVPVPDGCSYKTINIMNWLSDHRPALKKLSFSVDSIPDSKALTLRLLTFTGSTNLPDQALHRPP